MNYEVPLVVHQKKSKYFAKVLLFLQVQEICHIREKLTATETATFQGTYFLYILSILYYRMSNPFC